MEKLRKIRHDCLTSSLASFEYGETFFIVLPFAASTLDKYLRSSGVDFTPQVLWEQMQGLAEGLEYLHGFDDEYPDIAYHLDLKPSNILTVDGKMQIADFGLSQFKQLRAKSESGSGTSNPLGYLAYAPPEHNDPRVPGKSLVTRAYDLWSLGAIFSEVATFDIQKQDKLAVYRQHRRDEYENRCYGTLCFHLSNGEMKETVLKQHRDLLADIEASKKSENRRKLHEWQERFYSEDFFVLIEKTMLAKDPKNRKSAGFAAGELERFRGEAVKSPLALRHPPNVWHQARNGSLPGKPDYSM